MPLSVDEQKDEIAAACRQYGIERLFILGSAIRDYFRLGENDIDLLVGFGPINVTKKFRTYLDARAMLSGGSSMQVLTWQCGERLRTRLSPARLIAPRS